jgi:Na+/melibiose symporter-like transporter
MIATGGIWVLAFYFKNINEEGPGTFTRHQFDFIFGLCALLLILSAIVAFFMIKEPQDTSKPRKISQDIKMIFDVQEMKKHKDFLKLFNDYGPWMIRIIDLLTIPNDINTLLLGIIPAAVIATIVISKYNRLVDKIGRKKSTMLALIFIPLACSFIAFSNYNFIIIVISLGTLLSFNMGLSISISTWTQDLLPQESRAKFLGIINIGSAGFQIPGVLIAGIVAETYSVLSIFFVSAIYLLISIPIFLIVPDIYRNTESQKKNREL